MGLRPATMMPQFLSRMSKLSPGKDSLMQSFRLFSSYCPPYCIFGSNTVRSYNGGGPGVINFWTSSEWEFLEEERKVPCEWLDAMGTIEASKGWVATLKNRFLCLQDDMKVDASVLNPKCITLPPFQTLPHSQTQMVTGVAMSSSSPDEDQDCVVAVKFLGPQLSLCRPAHDSEWTNIRITDPSFFTSSLMFSHRSQMFSLPASGGGYVASCDLLKHRDVPKLQKLHFQNLPRSSKKERELFDSYYRTEHLVESPAGETFLVIWYRTAHYGCDDDLGTKGFRVFRLDEEGNASYTEDIGDLCIYLSKSEPFCVSASSFPGHDANCIFYIDVDDSMSGFELGCFYLGGAARAKKENIENYSNNFTFNVPYFFPPQPMR